LKRPTGKRSRLVDEKSRRRQFRINLRGARSNLRPMMPQLRKDPVVGRWVIISTERAKRPQDFSPRREASKDARCPFCPGNEKMTPPEILAYRPDGSETNRPGWTLRIVPNKFPALTIEGDLNRRCVGVYELMNGLGVHEVIVETPRHEVNAGKLTETQFEDILRAYRSRILELRKDTRFHYVLIFKNQGSEAGATLEHIHSQLIALPIVPRDALEELIAAKKYYRSKQRCIYCDIVRKESKDQSRVVFENDYFLALCPFAARFPYETWLLPRKHSPFFERSSEQERAALARALREALNRLNRALNNPPFNYIVHSNPLRDGRTSHYHWHIEIMPKLTQVAGFEWGSGFYINPVAPEDAARSLREIVR
jgi:UDPglucose--hexose-1-phosphate uridylyltransferase